VDLMSNAATEAALAAHKLLSAMSGRDVPYASPAGIAGITARPRVQVEEIVVDCFGDRWVKYSTSVLFKNADQDDDRLTRAELADRHGPLSPYRQEV
jgi:hypothetical protein